MHAEINVRFEISIDDASLNARQHRGGSDYFSLSQRQKRVFERRRCSNRFNQRLAKSQNYAIWDRCSDGDGDASPRYFRRRGAGGER